VTVDKIVHTACAAHSWLTNNAMGTYLPRGSVDNEDIDRGEIIPGNWRSEVRGMVDMDVLEAIIIRSKLKRSERLT
jgi:hypothetical protein